MPVFSEIVNISDFRNFEIETIFFKNGIFLRFEGVLVSPKIDNIGFGARGHVQKSRNHKDEEFAALP